MKSPAFQFYAADWLANVKLRRCSPAARGAWIDVLCLMHGSDEYGVLRWPLAEIAGVVNVPTKTLRELVDRGVLKGADSGAADYIYTPRHGGKYGDPVVLVTTKSGPCWYSSRFVRDEWIRQRRGANTRFGTDNQPPTRSPTRRVGERQGEQPSGAPTRRESDGASSSVFNPSTKGKNKTPVAAAPLPDWLPPDVWESWRAERRERKKTMTTRAENEAIGALSELRARGHDPVAVIRQSIANGWSGLFELKQNGQRAPPNGKTAKQREAEAFMRSIGGGNDGNGGNGNTIDGTAERVADHGDRAVVPAVHDGLRQR